MARHLKLFETTASYEAAQSDLILPNVSVTLDNNVVHYNPFDPCTQYDYVEIGGKKWAAKNVGACEITGTGLYFAWADSSGYTAAQVGVDKNFIESDYKFGYPSSDITKYNKTDHLTVIETVDDAASVIMGTGWRMPTKDEYVELVNATTSAWTSNYEGSGVAGFILTDKNDSSKKLFFPATGFAFNGVIKDTGTKANYWSSSLYVSFSDVTSDSAYSFSLNWSTSSIKPNNTSRRWCGYNVRGVLNE